MDMVGPMVRSRRAWRAWFRLKSRTWSTLRPLHALSRDPALPRLPRLDALPTDRTLPLADDPRLRDRRLPRDELDIPPGDRPRRFARDSGAYSRRPPGRDPRLPVDSDDPVGRTGTTFLKSR